MVRLDCRIIDKTLGKVADTASATFPRVLSIMRQSRRTINAFATMPSWRSSVAISNFFYGKKNPVPQVPGTWVPEYQYRYISVIGNGSVLRYWYRTRDAKFSTSPPLQQIPAQMGNLFLPQYQLQTIFTYYSERQKNEDLTSHTAGCVWYFLSLLILLIDLIFFKYRFLREWKQDPCENLEWNLGFSYTSGAAKNTRNGSIERTGALLSSEPRRVFLAALDQYAK